VTGTEVRLAELAAIRDRSLTNEEQAEAYRLIRLQRQCEQRRERYRTDASLRERMRANTQRSYYRRRYGEAAE
jgi:hypothetical protein